MKTLPTLILSAFLLFFLANCRHDKGIDGYYLPDLNTLFDGYDALDSTRAYAAFANKITEANRDLNSSELYVEAASLYAQAGNSDSAIFLLHKAIDNGMANPNVLNRLDINPGTLEGALWENLRQRLDSIENQLSSIKNFSLEIDAMNAFWPYFERARQNPSKAKQVFKEYIFSGPREVRDFYAVRYYSTEDMYGQMINASPKYYTYLREKFDPAALLAMKDQTATGMAGFQELYPEAIFPKVFVVPGILNTGGTATDMGLFVGGDMYGKSDSMPTEELTDWQRDAIMEASSLPALTLHELMHFQQNYRDKHNVNNVLFKLVQEGVCDLLVELSTGHTQKNNNLKYLEDPRHRNKVLGELQMELYSDDLSKWMYNGGSIQDRPHDLGYTIGYLITKSYYEKQGDKKKAIYELLNSDNLRNIVLESDYAFLVQPSL